MARAARAGEVNMWSLIFSGIQMTTLTSNLKFSSEYG